MQRKVWGIFLIFCFINLSGFTVIGHRGEPAKAPEHSFQSYDQALADHADYIEQDLEISQDGVLLVSHDPMTDRTMNRKYIIDKNSWQTLKQAEFTNHEHLHRLSDVFERYRSNPKAKFMIETRLLNNQMVMEDKLVALVKANHLEKRVYFESFSMDSLEKLHHLLPEVPLLFLNYNEPYNYRQLQSPRYNFLSAVSMRVSYASDQVVKTLHQAHKQVIPYDNFSENISRAADNRKKFDGFFTNYTGVYTHQNKCVEHPQTITTQAKGTTKVFDSPFKCAEYRSIEGKRLNLKPNTTWQVNYALKGLDNQVYYDLGSSQWIKAPQPKKTTLLSRIWEKIKDIF